VDHIRDVRLSGQVPPMPASAIGVKRALVLAGGGVAGIAWELGVLQGIADIAPDAARSIREADLVVGTSAGATVAAQLTSDIALDRLYSAQLSENSSEVTVDLDLEDLRSVVAAATAGARSAHERRRRLGALALSTQLVDGPTRRAVIAARLPSHDWPHRRLLVTAVDAETGRLMSFERDSGVDLIDAVAASSAVPGVWPPVRINGRHYIDGGVRSGTNADLAEGNDRILVLTPAQGGFTEKIDRLRPAQLLVVQADEASLDSFLPNPLSPSTRRPAAEAGRAVGRAHALRVARFWC
jgi:NTE family protein